MYNQTVTTINTEEEIKNNFWICIFHNNPFSKLDNSLDKDSKIDSLLTIGKIYETGIFPKFIIDDNQKLLVLGEYFLEKDRLLKYKDYPSRCSSVYVFPNLDEMNRCINTYQWMKYNPKILNIYINLKKPYKILKANMEIISSIRAGNPNEITLADYWEGKHEIISYPNNRNYFPISELIIEGELLIKENEKRRKC